MCDIEFTIEDGKLWMLQTRVGKRTPEAAFRVAHAMVGEGLIDLDEALRRVTGAQLARLMFPRFDDQADARPASPPASMRRPGPRWAGSCSTPRPPWHGRGGARTSSCVREETNPDDLPGMVAARGTLTSRGGKTSHAAVVARGMGRPCVCGADDADRRPRGAAGAPRGRPVIEEGDMISVDGTTGAVYAGEVPVVDSVVVRHFDGDDVDDPVVDAVAALLDHADGVRRMGVRANADTPEDAARARRFGAGGIGLCRTEHMFLGERRVLVENLVLADDEAGRERRARRDAPAAARGLRRDPGCDGWAAR